MRIFSISPVEKMEEKILEELDDHILSRFGEVTGFSWWLHRFYGLMNTRFALELVTASRERLRSLQERLGRSSITPTMLKIHETSLESITSLIENRKSIFREDHPHGTALSLIAASYCQGRSLDMTSASDPSLVHVAISYARTLYRVAKKTREILPVGARDPLLDFVMHRMGEMLASTNINSASLERIRNF